jgi:hypothetical protein
VRDVDVAGTTGTFLVTGTGTFNVNRSADATIDYQSGALIINSDQTLTGLSIGDGVNALPFEALGRVPDPQRLVRAYNTASATLNRRRLKIRHYNRMEDRETDRVISPQRLVHYRDNWYVDAWCHLRTDLRSFAVDAIREARLVDGRAKEIPAAELDEHLGAGYGIFAGKKVEWATLKFTPEAARWVSAQSWHPNQRARIEKDGSYFLELPYAEAPELVMEILEFGPDVEVLAPASLRERVADLLAKAARRYGGDGALQP